MKGIAYSTASEFHFLNGLSLQSLKNYLAAAVKRTDWSGMNADDVLVFCRKRIESIEKRPVGR